MVYDGKFEYEGEIINYILNRASYKVQSKGYFEENPYVSVFIDLFFENGKTINMPVYDRQDNFTTLKSEYVKKKYIEYLEEQKIYK